MCQCHWCNINHAYDLNSSHTTAFLVERKIISYRLIFIPSQLWLIHLDGRTRRQTLDNNSKCREAVSTTAIRRRCQRTASPRKADPELPASNRIQQVSRYPVSECLLRMLRPCVGNPSSLDINQIPDIRITDPISST